MATPDLDIIIINHNTCQLTIDCIESIERTKGSLSVAIIVVDNASNDGSATILQQRFPEVSVIALDANLGYGAAANKALPRCKAECVIVSNNDVLFQESSLAQLAATIVKNPLVGVVGPQQFYRDGTWQRSFGMMPGIRASLIDVLGLTFLYRLLHRNKRIDDSPSASRPRSVEYLDGAVLCFRRSAIEQSHGFDERFYFFCEDMDVCYTIRHNGWQVVHLSSAKVIHLRGATRSTSIAADLRYIANNLRARYLFIRKYHSGARARITAAIEAAYYAEVMLVHYGASYLLRGAARLHHRQKADLCRHLISICAEEIEHHDAI